MPGLNSGRPIANIDQSGIAKGVAALGQGISNLGEGVAAYQKAQDDFTLQKTLSVFETERVGLDSTFDQDQDYATRPKRYGDELTKLRAKVLEGISPRVAEQFNIRVDPVAARAVERQKDIGFKLETDAERATLHTRGNALMDAAAKTSDPLARDRMVRNHSAMVDALVDSGRMGRQEAQAYKEAWGQKYVITRGAAAAADGEGESVLNDLQATPNSMPDMVNRIIKIESGGDPKKRTSTSSAYGVAQFLATGKDTTWRDLVSEFRPDLTEGKSVGEIDDMRADPNLSREMLGKLLEKNKTILKGQGVEVTPAALYLSHFLGPKSAIAVLKASPGKPIADVLAGAVGPDFARKMIESNMNVLGGRQAGTLVQWAESKMGGASNSALYGLLRPEQRAQLQNHVEGVLHKQKVSDLSDFQSRVKDSEVEARATGTVEKPIGQWEFISRLGFEEGRKWHASYSANVQLGRDEATLANLDPQETTALFDKYAPQPGPGYAENMQRRDSLMAAKGRIKEEQKDPAKFAVTRLPAVTAAFSQFEETLNKPGVSAADQQWAAKMYANATLMEQARVGIPAADRRIVSSDYVTKMLADFSNQPAAGGPSQIAAKIEEQARLWGDNWPNVYRSIRDKNPGPAIEVIGSLIDPGAARILVDLQPHKIHKILNVADDNDVKVKEVNAAVRTAMVPFGNSTLGHDGRSHTLEVFQGQIEKLTAYYVATLDKGVTAAAELAYKNVIGHKYEFQDTYRVPHGTGVEMPVIAAGAWYAKTLIGEGKFATEPSFKDMPGPLSRDYRERETDRAYARDGVWVTAQLDGKAEMGLALVYKGEPVAMRDGKPLVLSWKDLAEIAKESPLGKAPSEEARAAAAVVLARKVRGGMQPPADVGMVAP